jgi:glycosyltransferase involved in cell wall biosynthesis
VTQPFLSVVIPAYNEAARIEDTLAQIHAYLSLRSYPWEIVVSDDGSVDRTARLVSAFAAANPGVRLLSLEHRGKGWAVQQGMLAATGVYRFLCDADLSMPVEQLARFLVPEVGEADILVGSRELAQSRRFGEPARRRLMGRVFNLLIRTLALPGIQDTQCGFKLFRAETTLALFERQTLWGFAFDVEVLYLARRAGLVVREVAIDWHYGEGSKVRPLRDAVVMAWDVIKVSWRLRTKSEN